MNIEDLKEYMYEIVSSIVLLGAIIFFILNSYYYPMLDYKKKVESITNGYYNREYVKFTAKKEKNVKKDDKVVAEISTIPEFLKKINETCRAPKVIIRNLLPDATNPFQFKLEFISSYFDFLQVLSEFEKLNISILNISIQPYEIDKNNPRHLINLSIVAIGKGERLSEKNVAFLDKELAKKDKRNPFQRFAKTPLGVKIVPMIDLTYLHKLSGIGKVGDENIATIDARQYSKGDKFEDKIVKEVTTKSVLLIKETDNGVVKYIIRFRNFNKKSRGDK